MRTLKKGGPDNPAEWKLEVVCDVDFHDGGCGSRLEIYPSDLDIIPHLTEDSREALRLWFECHVVCEVCGRRIFVPNVPLRVAQYMHDKRKASKYYE